MAFALPAGPYGKCLAYGSDMAPRRIEAPQNSLLAAMIPDRERISWLLTRFSISFAVILAGYLLKSPKAFFHHDPMMTTGFIAMQSMVYLAIWDFIDFLQKRDG